MVLAFSWDMAKALECAFDVAGHGEIHGVGCVVPFEVDATVGVAFPISSYFVLFREEINEIICMFFANVFDTKVIMAESILAPVMNTDPVVVASGPLLILDPDLRYDTCILGSLDTCEGQYSRLCPGRSQLQRAVESIYCTVFEL